MEPQWVDRSREIAERCYQDEADALQSCLDIQPRAFPTYIARDQLTQGESDPLAGGYIRVIAMSKVPGNSVVDIGASLTSEDEANIRTQLTRTLEYVPYTECTSLSKLELTKYVCDCRQIRLKGFTFDKEETEQIFYDTRTREMQVHSHEILPAWKILTSPRYIIGFSRIGRELWPPREENRITESSVYVTAFGMGWAKSAA